MPIPVAARSKTWPLSCWDCLFEFSRSHACLSLVSSVCCQIEVYAKGRSLVQRNTTDCGVYVIEEAHKEDLGTSCSPALKKYVFESDLMWENYETLRPRDRCQVVTLCTTRSNTGIDFVFYVDLRTNYGYVSIEH